MIYFVSIYFLVGRVQLERNTFPPEKLLIFLNYHHSDSLKVN